MITEKEVCCERTWHEIERFIKEKEGKVDRKIFGNVEKYGYIVSGLRYDESRREYSLLSGVPISYCPSCGKKLPERLDPEETIRKEYGDKALPPKVRKEFDTDKWWKKRKM